jgi:hypothetical protein
MADSNDTMAVALIGYEGARVNFVVNGFASGNDIARNTLDRHARSLEEMASGDEPG